MRQLKISIKVTPRSGDSLARYLQDISRYPMLTVDEEVELTRRIHQGDQEALERLVNANLRFVVSVAKQYQGQGMSLTDLINEGNVGLIIAAEKFDETRGFKFITYAVWWIRQSIMQALATDSRLVRIPLNQVGNATKVNRFERDFVQENERRPSTLEIADALGLDPDKVGSAQQGSGRHGSLDAPLSENEDSTMLDLIPSTGAEATDGELETEGLRAEISRAMESLSEREQTVVTRSFGLGCPVKSLDEIAEQLGLSRERVRQIREKAIRLLRQSGSARLLREYL